MQPEEVKSEEPAPVVEEPPPPPKPKKIRTGHGFSISSSSEDEDDLDESVYDEKGKKLKKKRTMIYRKRAMQRDKGSGEIGERSSSSSR
jgi:hypothetical protein